jgi:DNA modification methylase
MSANKLAGKLGKEATHSGGKGEILHDWFPYLEGFSPTFVNNLLAKFLPDAKLILEPFAGVGTTPLSLVQQGISTAYCELNPVLRELISAKQAVLLGNNTALVKNLDKLSAGLSKLLEKATEDKNLRKTYTDCFLLSIYFPEENFIKILKLKSIERKLDKSVQKYFSIAVFSSLLEASFLKRAGDVRFKTKKDIAKGIPAIEDLVSKKLALISKDIQAIDKIYKSKITLLAGDSKELKVIKPIQADGVITSPPYLNGTNYFRNTKVELWYSEFMKTQADLKNLRHHAITAGINDVEKDSGKTILDEVKKVYLEISEVCYDKRIPKMIAAYFTDMKQVFQGIQRNVKHGGIICVDIGDSVYSNVHIPTHKILIKVGLSIGWSLVDEIVLRERFSNNGAKLSQRLLVFKNE